MGGDWTIFVAIAAFIISALQFFTRSLDKSLSIREHEANQSAVARDISRIEQRVTNLEQSRPTTGELKILSDGLNKRLDEISRRGDLPGSRS